MQDSLRQDVYGYHDGKLRHGRELDDKAEAKAEKWIL